MHCEWKSKLRSHNTSYCLIEVVTKAGSTVQIGLKIKKKYFGHWSLLASFDPFILETTRTMSNLFKNTYKKFHKESKEKTLQNRT